MELLSKSKIISGNQCHKKLWLQTHTKQDKSETHLFALGKRFGSFVKRHYGLGIDLTSVMNKDEILEATDIALKDSGIKVIYEAAFLYNNVLVRIDVLKRYRDYWEIIEVKSSQGAKSHHIDDLIVQTYVAQGCGLKLKSMKIAHINSEFLYLGNEDYSGLVSEIDFTQQVIQRLSDANTWVDDLLPVVQSDTPMPIENIDEHKCNSPYACQFLSQCQTNLPKLAEVPIDILPNTGKKLAKKWAKEEIYDLRNLPDSALANERHKIIRKAHISNTPYISSDMVKKVRSLPAPYLFMDFETVAQGVPLIPNTKPNDAIPFQWSVHSLDNLTDTTGLHDGKYFLDFLSPSLFSNFLTSLIDALGESGTIFVHHKSTEIKALRYLISHKQCKGLKASVEKIIPRIEDTLDLVRSGMYFPEMGLSEGGTYSIKTITKVIPTSVDYQESGELASGNDAQLIWFKCTDPNNGITNEEIQAYKNKLLKYCAKDTLALVDLLRFINSQFTQ